MTDAQIATSLRAVSTDLRRLGVRSLALFGSAARGESGPGSDLDFLYEFAPGAATLDHLLELEDVLRTTFRRDVDLVSRPHLSPILKRYIGDDIVPVFEG